LQHLVTRAQRPRQEFLLLLRQILQNGAGLEQRDRRAAADRVGIADRGDPVVRRNFEEILTELFALGDVDGEISYAVPASSKNIVIL
jgi:hypothetical protein